MLNAWIYRYFAPCKLHVHSALKELSTVCMSDVFAWFELYEVEEEQLKAEMGGCDERSAFGAYTFSKW